MKRKIYLCSRVRKESRPFNDRIATSLESLFEVYVPHRTAPNNPVDGRYDAETIFQMDFAAMKTADICVVAGGDVGKDCSWEIGYFFAQGIPIYFVPNESDAYLSSPMLVPSLHNTIIDPDKAAEAVYDAELRRKGKIVLGK